jgi:hypothetical protein
MNKTKRTKKETVKPIVTHKGLISKFIDFVKGIKGGEKHV